jgi:hypothetical protein
VFEILGHRYEMQPLVDEIADIHERIVACCRSGSRLPYLDEPGASEGA